MICGSIFLFLFNEHATGGQHEHHTNRAKANGGTATLGNFVLYFIYHSGVLGGFSFLYGRGRNAFCLNGFAADCTFGMPGTIYTGLCLRVNDPVSLGVRKGTNGLLRRQSLAAHRAYRALGQARLGTGCINGGEDLLSVTERAGRIRAASVVSTLLSSKILEQFAQVW